MFFKIRFFSIVSGIILATSCTSDNHCHKPPTNQFPVAVPHIKIITSQEPISSLVLSKIKTAEEDPSLVELEGKITNKYGIRDDILEYIEKNVPPANIKAKQAIIKTMQYENQIYYHVNNQKKALELVRKAMLATSCFVRAWPNKWDSVATYLGKLLTNTKERMAHIRNLDTSYFGWHILGTGLVSSEETKNVIKEIFNETRPYHFHSASYLLNWVC